jgi:hypothetical protein
MRLGEVTLLYNKADLKPVNPGFNVVKSYAVVVKINERIE